MFNHKNIKNNNPHYSLSESSGGYTLIELVISIGVFTLGIIGVLGLAVSNYSDSQDNVDRVIAVNLAREGLELIKNVRDSNWLKIEANDSCSSSACTWDYGFNDSVNYMVMSYNDDFPTFLPSFCNNSIKDCVNTYITNGDGVELYINATGNYDHDNTGTLTKFSRVIKIDRICFREEPLVQDGWDPHDFEYFEDMNSVLVCRENPNDLHVGFALTSYVQWEDDNGTQDVEISSSIYDWRR